MAPIRVVLELCLVDCLRPRSVRCSGSVQIGLPFLELWLKCA